MELNWIQSILYALISGITEFLPVSSNAHQAIILHLLGISGNPALLDLLIHIAVLAALLANCRNMIAGIQRTQKLLRIPKKRRKRQPDPQILSDIRLIKTAAVPMLLMVLLIRVAAPIAQRLQILAACLVLNGIFLYITGHIPIGNKTAGSMNRFESLLIGLAGGAGFVPGISRMGAGTSVAIMRGADPQRALNWSLILSVPVLIALCIADIVLIFTAGIGSFGFLLLLKYLVSAAFAYAGAYVAIALLRFMAVKVGFSWFSYYSWGLALLSFVLFMI